MNATQRWSLYIIGLFAEAESNSESNMFDIAFSSEDEKPAPLDF